MSFAATGGLGDRASNHTAHVVEQLGRAIVAGEYPPRTMIPLDPDIEEMFAVSRTVVREAKKTLIAKGLLQSKAKVGTRVTPASQWNMFDADVLRWHAALKQSGAFLDELFEIRLIFEPAAAAQVATQASPADCARLEGLCDDLAASNSRMAFAVADLEFHKSILHLSGNRFLQSLGDLVQAALYSLFAAETQESGAARSAQDMEEVVQSHRDIVAAIARGEPQNAYDAMARVIRTAKAGLG